MYLIIGTKAEKKRRLYRSVMWLDTMMSMTKKRKIILFSFGAVTLFVAGILVFIMGHIQTKAEVRVESNIESDVYLNNVLVGVTPFTHETVAVKSFLKIVPHEKNKDYLPYETALSLTPQTKTIVRHNFNDVISNATTQIISLKNERENSSPITIITNPESAYVFVNNEYLGTSPLRIEKPPATYSVQVMHTGFQAMQVTLKSALGYNLTAFLDLAVQSPVGSDTGKSVPLDRQQPSDRVVTILKTPTGYVRVHESPKESSQEISRAILGREYPFEGYSPLKDWTQINLNASESGWILTRYATVSASTK